MAIYKVRIKTEGNTTTYTTNATTLATIIFSPEAEKWDITAPYTKERAHTQKEADKTARESITAFFASMGLTADFVCE